MKIDFQSILFSLFCLGMILIMPIVMITIGDVRTFRSVLSGDYETPYFDKNPLKNPFTSYMLGSTTPEYYITTNSIGSQVWVCERRFFGGKEFWTVLERQELE